MPGWFAVLFFGALAFSVASMVWRASTARRMAQRSGMDPDEATMMALMTEDGLDATYLASNLRGDTARLPSPKPPVAQRLMELQDLKDQGLITDEEYAARRRAILDEI